MLNIINVTSDKNIGGAGRCILTFLKNYDREKFNVKVVVPRGSALIPYIEQTGTKFIEADGIADMSYSKEGTKSLKQILKQEKPDLVHAHASLSARIAAKMLRIPVIYTRHSVFPNPKNITHGLGKLKNGLINNLTANKIIAVANAAKDNLTEAGVSEKKITVVKNGVDPVKKYTAEELEQARNFYGLTEENFVFGMIARVEDIKGHDFFLEAAHTLRGKFPNARYFICGTGSYAKNVKQKINDLDLNDVVIYLGHVNDVTSVMNVINVNVNASYGTEATSLSLLEGMSLGKPIVASNYGGNPELVENSINGMLFESKNKDELADCMQKIMENRDLYETLCEGAKKLYEEKYTSGIMTKNIENVYFETLKRGRTK
ncbi:MAG: glycosyltransferase family 4 protein [Clostridia bacterium]|nr:glycosyltransferase family 4 protein [Clostridia bacterium]